MCIGELQWIDIPTRMFLNAHNMEVFPGQVPDPDQDIAITVNECCVVKTDITLQFYLFIYCFA